MFHQETLHFVLSAGVYGFFKAGKRRRNASGCGLPDRWRNSMKMRTLTNIKGITLLLSLLMVLGTTGCLFSPDDGDDSVIGGNELPYADTEQKLMDNFKKIYEDMLIDDFRDMLHTDYQTILLPATILDWGWEQGATFDRDDEINIHENMFGGSPGTDHLGDGVNPLDYIQVDLFERISGDWVSVPEDDPNFPNSRKALYQVDIRFYDNTGDHAFVVQQEVVFYVKAVDDGGRDKFLLRGQIGRDTP